MAAMHDDLARSGGTCAGGDVTARPLRVVVCGEARSGKSALLNSLLRARVLPDNIGAATRPQVTVWGEEGQGTVMMRGDREGWRQVTNSDALQGADMVEITSDLPGLAGVELTELPLTTADEITPEQVAAVQTADVLIWTTIASQAWRLTERQILEVLAPVLPARGLIAITRADKLRTEADRKQIFKRLNRECPGFFTGVLFLGASRHLLDEAMESEEAWSATGGRALAAQVKAWREVVVAENAAEAAATSSFAKPAAVKSRAGTSKIHQASTNFPQMRNNFSRNEEEVMRPASRAF